MFPVRTAHFSPALRVSTLSILTVVVGIALLAFTITQVGWADVVSGIASVGWACPVLCARRHPHGLSPAPDGLRRGSRNPGTYGTPAPSHLPFSTAFGAIIGRRRAR